MTPGARASTGFKVNVADTSKIHAQGYTAVIEQGRQTALTAQQPNCSFDRACSMQAKEKRPTQKVITSNWNTAGASRTAGLAQ